MPGRLVVIEGIDGSGKGTHSRLLVEWLRTRSRTATLIAFPRYGETVFGATIARYLNGEFGSLDAVPPEFSALLFACERFESRGLLLDSLASSDFVVCDRYVPSNLAHQGARVPPDRRSGFCRWLERVEYEVFGVPRPDAVVWLDIDVEIAQQLVRRKGARRYTALAADLHEADRRYLEQVRLVYASLAKQQPGWIRIPVATDQRLRTIDEVQAEIRQAVMAMAGNPMCVDADSRGEQSPRLEQESEVK